MWNNERTVFEVVFNDDDQYSIWPGGTPAPEGWSKVGYLGSRTDCLAYIERVWTDMRPPVVRKQAHADLPVPEGADEHANKAR
jgi:MbtH protein